MHCFVQYALGVAMCPVIAAQLLVRRVYESRSTADLPSSAVQSIARCLPFGLEGSLDRRGGLPAIGLSYYVTPPDLDC